MAALVGETSDNLPGVPGRRRRRPPPSGSTSTASFDGVDRARRPDQGQGRRQPARAPRRRACATTSSTALVCDLELPLAPGGRRAGTGWDREAVHQVFDALRVPGPARPALPVPRGGRAGGRGRLRPGRRASCGTGAVGAWLDRARAGRRAGRRRGDRHVRPRHRLADRASRVATARRAGRLVRPGRSSTPTDDAAVAAWLADPRPAQGDPRRKPALLAFAAHGWHAAPASPATPRSRPTWPARPALLRPDRPRAALPASGSCGSTRPTTASSPSTGSATTDERRAEPHAARPGHARPGRRDRREELSRDGGASPRLLAEVEQPLVEVLAEMEQVGIAADTRLPVRAGGALRGRGEGGRAGARYAVVGREFNLGSPKQLQEILFTELGLPKTKRIKTGLHHRRRRAAEALRADRHPLLEHLLRHRDVAKLKSTVDGLLKSVSDDGRIHTTFYQTVAATGRLSSAPTPTCRTSRSAPRRAGGSGGRSSSARASRRC